jgi:hypothetical protein
MDMHDAPTTKATTVASVRTQPRFKGEDCRPCGATESPRTVFKMMLRFRAVGVPCWTVLRLSARLAVASLLAASCSSDSGDRSVATTVTSAAAASTTQPSTPTSPETVPATEPAITNAPTTPVVVSEGFRPSCTESQRADQSTVSFDEASLAQLGPLQVEPALRLSLPEGVSKFSPEPQATSVQPVRVPGGVLLNVRSSSNGYFPGSILAIIDDDGTARWVRCLPNLVTQIHVAPASTTPTTAIIAVAVDQVDAPSLSEYRLVSLLDGSTTGTLADHFAGQGVDAAPDLRTFGPEAATETKLLFGLPDGTIIDVARDHLLLVDIPTLTAELLPFPEFSNGTDMLYNGFRLDANGDPYLAGSEGGKDIVLRSYHDGAWSDGPSPLPLPSSVTVDFELSPSLALVAKDAHGAEVWRRDDIVSHGGEGFRTASSGNITVAFGCAGSVDEQNDCSKPLLAGIRTSSGKTAWTLDGWRGVSAVGDGYALITDFDMRQSASGGGWILIDTATGQPVDGQHWSDPATFQQECCGGDELFHVWRLGGILVAAAEGHVSIYYPRDSGLSGHELSLP